MVLNDNGNLNLVKFASVSNSTIVGQPVSHLQISHRSNVTILTPSRTAGSRNGVTVDTNLNRSGRCRRRVISSQGAFDDQHLDRDLALSWQEPLAS